MTAIGPHTSHVLRSSDASTFDTICINCNHTDEVPGGWGKLTEPCPNPVISGGITLDDYYRKLKRKIIDEVSCEDGIWKDTVPFVFKI